MDDDKEFVRLAERFARDPLADAVLGTERVLSVSEPRGRWPYQACRLEVATDAVGIEPRTITIEAAVARKHWPRVDQVLPARIARDNDLVDVDWDALAR